MLPFDAWTELNARVVRTWLGVDPAWVSTVPSALSERAVNTSCGVPAPTIPNAAADAEIVVVTFVLCDGAPPPETDAWLALFVIAPLDTSTGIVIWTC